MSVNPSAMGQNKGLSELWKRLRFVLMAVIIYRIGTHIPIPGIDPDKLSNLFQQNQGTLLDLFNMFSGGALERMSIMALNIMPYITASIIMSLLEGTTPSLKKRFREEGEEGRRMRTNYVRWGTVGLALVQATGLALGLQNQGLALDPGMLFQVLAVTSLVTGTVFLMWLGELVTERGIGNGISLLIMVGIIANMPLSFAQEFDSAVNQSQGGLIKILIELVIWFVIILASIMLVMAVRKIAVQYARRTASGGYEKNIMGSRQYIPLKLNASGVMPIIFAQAIMFVPGLLGGLDILKDSTVGQWLVSNFAGNSMFGLWYNIVFALLIIIFTYFYTAITVPTNKMADDLKRSGGFIPGIRPGSETSEYLDKIMSQITLPGSMFLALIAVFPAIIVRLMDIQQGWALFFGGTSLLIMVGVAIDTMQQVNSYLLNKHYDGLMKTGKNRKAVQ